MKQAWIHLASVCVLVAVASAAPSADWLKQWKKANPVWRGVHLGVGSDADLVTLENQVPRLAAAGVNVIVVEVDYSFQFWRRPEMCDKTGISKRAATKFARTCRANGIRPIPQINCLGHQSWEGTTDALLRIHPEFDETPDRYPQDKGIYCRSWCPQNPDVYKVVFDLIDDLADAFQADAFHVGMDEVFLIGSEFCPRCNGKDTATLFAKAVNALHAHIVGTRKLEMFMWGDRLLDGKATGYGEWEASENGTFRAIDMIPKDIVMCDWHYDKRPDYPSLKTFVDKGFRVWPSGWKDAGATAAFAQEAKAMTSKLVIGHLCTTWGEVKTEDLPTWAPLLAAMKIWNARKWAPSSPISPTCESLPMCQTGPGPHGSTAQRLNGSQRKTLPP